MDGLTTPAAEKDHAAAVLIVTPQGIPLVQDPKKSRRLWKLPGGRSRPGELPTAVAVREIREEIGVELEPTQLKVLAHRDKGTHWHTIFMVELPSLPPLKQFGDEGEEIRVFMPEELRTANDILPSHAEVMLSALPSA